VTFGCGGEFLNLRLAVAVNCVPAVDEENGNLQVVERCADEMKAKVL
jgi:hypothetical protein